MNILMDFIKYKSWVILENIEMHNTLCQSHVVSGLDQKSIKVTMNSTIHTLAYVLLLDLHMKNLNLVKKKSLLASFLSTKS